MTSDPAESIPEVKKPRAKNPAVKIRRSKKAGRKFLPTEPQRRMVIALLGAGVTKTGVAHQFGMAPQTFARNFKHEIDIAADAAYAQALARVVESAEGGSVSAQRFLLTILSGDERYKRAERKLRMEAQQEALESRRRTKEEQAKAKEARDLDILRNVKTTVKLGKKAQRVEDAKVATENSPWADLLPPTVQ